MFLASARTRRHSFEAEAQPSYHYGAAYAPNIHANIRYPTSDEPYDLSLVLPAGSDLTYTHQLNAVRRQSDYVPSSSDHLSSQNHEKSPSDTNHTHHVRPAHIAYPSRRPPTSAVIDDYQERESSPLRSDNPGDAAPPAASLKRKGRREKPRIELAPDQPPTTQGKPRARVYVACLQCRSRKIRCDGAKPECYNCSKRTAGTECNYDPIPKRRGPDKTPGARQRAVKDETDGGPIRSRRRRRHETTTRTSEQESPPEERHRSLSDSSSIRVLSPVRFPSPGSVTRALSAELSTLHHNIPEVCYAPHTPHSLQPKDISDDSLRVPMYDANSFNFSTSSSLAYVSQLHRTKYAYITQLDDSGDDDNDLLDVSCEPSLNFTRKIWWDALLSIYLLPSSGHRQTLTVSEREAAVRGITSDIRFLFNTSNYWFAFFHLPTFFGKYYDVTKRERIQPSLILALLAMSTFWQSSEIGNGRLGRERALRFRDEAQSALDASFNAGWIDETLAQAAWLLALFEVCAHPLHSSERCNSSMVVLDSIIRSLSLTLVDANDPKASTFLPGSVPAVLKRTQEGNSSLDRERALNPHLPSTNNHLHLDKAYDDGSFQHSFGEYAILFSGESISHSPAQLSSKDTIWALYDRSFLLWHGCLRMRGDNRATDIVKAQFAVQTWLEADAIEASLNRHTCQIERQFIFQAREYIFK
ncbi:hypothetical protein H0H81_002309 [Sphagnurus paluster]|uniref:Zn(2)-C6 fungal-type domain-containing protein n=1 Tax=Sphagnurus paluster TaxID=117069 RepID=A0A9P7FZU5_9AGAR|nr:hypothetical protein H0H81_002309 [Sphagnurus paluster]